MHAIGHLRSSKRSQSRSARSTSHWITTLPLPRPGMIKGGKILPDILCSGWHSVDRMCVSPGLSLQPTIARSGRNSGGDLSKQRPHFSASVIWTRQNRNVGISVDLGTLIGPRPVTPRHSREEPIASDVHFIGG
jgi:hypothetical protein